MDWVNAAAYGTIYMSGPSCQRIVFNALNKPGNKNWHNHVEYWNYDYPGGLPLTLRVLRVAM